MQVLARGGPAPAKNKKRRPGGLDGNLLRASHPNHVWGLDFEFDETADLRRLKLLNIVEFGSLVEARILIEDWRNEYNTWRPHGSLGGLTPAEYAQKCEHQRQPTHP